MKRVHLECTRGDDQGSEFAFVRADGLYAVVYAKSLREARRLAREAYAENDAAPAWLKRPDGSAIRLGGMFEGSMVVGINEANRTIRLEDGRMVMFQEKP